MWSRKPLLLSLLIVVVLTLCPGALLAGDRYYSTDKGFSLEFPSGWAVQEHLLGAEVVAYSSEPGDRLTVNVVTEELPSGITLDEYLASSTATMRQLLESFHEYERGQGALNGVPTRRLLYSYGSGQLMFKALVYLVVANQTGYAITCGAKPEVFDRGRPALERIAASFRLEARTREGMQIPAGSTQPEITVKTQPEPAPAEEPPPPRTAAPPPAPAVNPFTAAIEQDGQPVQVVGHEARLRRKPFVIVISFLAPDGILVNMAKNPQSFEAARAGAPLKGIPGFSSPGLVEGVRNPGREVYLSDNDYHYWFYSTPSFNRFDQTAEEGGLIVCRRTIASLFRPDKQTPLPIERFTGDALYLVLIKADRPGMFAEPREYQREYLKLIFSD